MLIDLVYILLFTHIGLIHVFEYSVIKTKLKRHWLIHLESALRVS